MAFTGYLSKYSLPELFQFIEEGFKTGLLTIHNFLDTSGSMTQSYYIWLRQGRLVAAANRLDNQGLVSIISHRGWASSDTIVKTFNRSPNMTMGLCLKSQGILQAEQLNLLFRSQITSQVTPLFQLQDAEFEFNFQATLPNAEMTGLSIPATEATLIGLRRVKNWTFLENKLPDISSSVLRKNHSLPHLHLDAFERKVWESADGKTTLIDIARKNQITLEQIQYAAFRLIVSNLIEEEFIINSTSQNYTQSNSNVQKDDEFDVSLQLTYNSPNSATRESQITAIREYNVETVLESSEKKASLSQSFLDNLMVFLQSQAG
ncbi:hypothetical protein B4U84_07620 [Westiellopsis prolifica IICB1]|nr:hypothetical protein B4U84_07620 [Westiellopsis prolifica IICB1]